MGSGDYVFELCFGLSLVLAVFWLHFALAFKSTPYIKFIAKQAFEDFAYIGNTRNVLGKTIQELSSIFFVCFGSFHK